MRRSQRIEDRMLLHIIVSNACPPPWRAPHLHHFCFTSPQPVRPKEASSSVSTIRDVMPLTVELAVRFSLHTQCKHWITGIYKAPLVDFYLPPEKCVGQCLKNWAPLRKLFVAPGVPSWLRACLLHMSTPLPAETGCKTCSFRADYFTAGL